MKMLIFERSQTGRSANAQQLPNQSVTIPSNYLRKIPANLPAVSELEVVRHYTNLSQQNYSIDTQFYPLGSCTMKYNPRVAHWCASLPGFLHLHPLSLLESSQGLLACLYDLQKLLQHITGMDAISLAPMAGAQGEFAGISMIAAYHQNRGDTQRREILVPDAAHGTNPASAAQCGLIVKEIPTTCDGDIDFSALEKAVSEKTAGLMLTNPSTLGVFERKIESITQLVHQKGGLLYYDGANFNALLGKYRPADMGFDVMHLNLHKTFATPHGGGGPGAGPVAANAKLAPYLPIPMVEFDPNATTPYYWLNKTHRPDSIGRLTSFMGNIGVALRAYVYIRLLGRQGLPRVAHYATLNANYLMTALSDLGYTLAYPTRRATHEFLLTLKPLTRQYGVTALDVAKRLLDYGVHAPTIYFPLLVPECLLIEPTETESKQQLDQFIQIMSAIMDEIRTQPDLVKQAPHRLRIGRLDEVKAAKNLQVIWQNDAAVSNAETVI